MMRWFVCVLLAAACAGALAKEGTSGITQFWTDDYKVFDQIYGKTSDKEIFGDALPSPTAGFGNHQTRLKNSASEKKERFVDQQNADVQDIYDYGNRYAGFINNNAKKQVNKNPFKATTKFIPSDFKPLITKDSDPETYNYLRHLEQLQSKQEQYGSGNKASLANFKPFLNYAPDESEETDGYKSIQDILKAHEHNKGKVIENNDVDDKVKYLNYGGPKNRNRKKVQPAKLSKGKFLCPGGRCRKRATTTYRGRTYLTRPIIRKIKKVYYS